MYKLSSISKNTYWFYLGFLSDSIIHRLGTGASDIGFPIFVFVCVSLILFLNATNLPCFHYFVTGFGIFHSEWKCLKCDKRIDPFFDYIPFTGIFYRFIKRVK